MHHHRMYDYALQDAKQQTGCQWLYNSHAITIRHILLLYHYTSRITANFVQMWPTSHSGQHCLGALCFAHLIGVMRHQTKRDWESLRKRPWFG